MDTKLIPQNPQLKYFLTFDFEMFNGLWVTFAAVVSSFPDCIIHKRFELGHTNAAHYFQLITKKSEMLFWKNNAFALSQNFAICDRKKCTQWDAEVYITSFIQDVVTEYPNVFILLDSPSKDMSIMNDILQKHNCPSLDVRGKNYYQPIDAWSFRLGILNLLKLSAKQLKELVQDLPDCQLKHEYHVCLFPLHTPYKDCMKIQYEHYKLLLFNKNE